MNYEEVETLLNDEDIKQIINDNEQQRKAKEEQGDFFNIFSILKVERNEVYTHSAMLCELLNPNGSHGMKGSFLKLFIEEIPLQNIPDKNELINGTIKVYKEKDIEPIKKNEEKGGKIDLLIEFPDSNYAIIIENKIDARDQKAQLARYYNYAKKSYKKNFTLFYLTKYGNEPSEIAKGKKLKGKTSKDKYWTCISYTKNIKSWLNKCMEKCRDSTLVRGTIKQYVNLIDKITDQELDMSDNKKIIKKIYSKDLVKIASDFEEIWQQKDSLVAEIIAEKIKEQNDGWNSCNFMDYKEPTTIVKEIDKGKSLYLFFEPKSCQIGYRCKKETKNLHDNLKKIPLVFFESNEPSFDGTWLYITISLKKESKTTNKTITVNYYNDICNALNTLENVNKS